MSVAGLNALDRHPVRVLVGLSVLVFLALQAWSWRADMPILLAHLEEQRRVDLFGQLANSGVAMLAVALTVLAILVSLPDQARIRELRGHRSWHLVQSTLLAAAGYSLLTVVLTHVATGVDGGGAGHEWLHNLILAMVSTAIMAIVAGGVAFALVIRTSHEPADPNTGRGWLRA